jgi:hypothetical protein
MFSVCRYKTEIVVVVPHPTGGLGPVADGRLSGNKGLEADKRSRVRA